MSIGKQLVEQLRGLSKREPHNAGVTATTSEHCEARAEIGEHDRFSATLHALEVQVMTRVSGDTHAFLSDRAAELARRLSYLEEPLGVWELDGREGQAQLRSSPPAREGEQVQYWEVTLTAGERPAARIVRYQWSPGMPERAPLAYPATFGLIGRMADSIAGALDGE
jgi:hypothetical protein